MAKKTKAVTETAAMGKPEIYEGCEKCKVENAVRVIQEAMAIKDDPKLLKAAQKLLKEKVSENKAAIDWAWNL